MGGVIEGGPQQVVHGGVDDGETARRPFLHVEDARHQDAGVAGDDAARLEDDAAADVAQEGAHQGAVLGRGRHRFVAIGDAQAAAEIETLYGVAVGAQARHQVAHPDVGVAEGFEVGYLGADMDGEPDDVDAVHGGGAAMDFAGAGPRHAELVFALAGGDLGVGAGVDIGVDADGDRRRDAPGPRHLVEGLEFGLRFDVDLQHAGGQRPGHLVPRLADAGEDDFAGRHAGGQGALELAARNHVGAGAEARQGAEDGDIGIGLHREAYQGVEPREGVGEDRVVTLQGRRRVAIERRAHGVRDARQRHGLGAQLALPVLEMVHGQASRYPCFAGYLRGYSLPSGGIGAPLRPQAARGAARARTRARMRNLRVM